jgi:hypothetical protein
VAFAPEEIEDGYGVPGALVYEQTEDAVDWLVRRGFTALRDLEEEEDRDAALLRATEAAEGAVRELLRGTPVTVDQGLLFPASGAYDSTGRLMLEDELPRFYLEGIRRLAEHVAAGTFMKAKAAGPPIGIEEEGSRQGRIKYRDGVDFSKLSTNHPEEWRLISSVVPPL